MSMGGHFQGVLIVMFSLELLLAGHCLQSSREAQFKSIAADGVEPLVRKDRIISYPQLHRSSHTRMGLWADRSSYEYWELQEPAQGSRSRSNE